MIFVVDLCIRAHEPDAGMIIVTFCCIAVIPLAVELYEEPVMDLAVTLRITVDSHILDSGNVQKHLAAGIVNIAVTAALCESSVCGVFIVPGSGKKSEPQIVMNPVEDGSCSLNIVLSVKTGHYFSRKSIRITVTYIIGSGVSAGGLILCCRGSDLDLYGRCGSCDISGLITRLVNDLISTCLGVINLSIIEGKHRLRIVIVRDRNSFQVIKLVRVTLELKFMKTADDRRCSVINYRKRNTDLGAVAVYIGNNYRY